MPPRPILAACALAAVAVGASPAAETSPVPAPGRIVKASGASWEFTGRRLTSPRLRGTMDAIEVSRRLPDGRQRSGWLRGRLLLRVDAAWNAAPAIAAGLAVEESLPGGWIVLRAASPDGAAVVRDAAVSWPGVREAHALVAAQRRLRFIPDDPLFATQWHLDSRQASANHIRVTGAWDSVRGTGIRIGIVDDGLQTAHPDLAANVDTVNDRDWNDATPDNPNPDVFSDWHGTACAGVAAARGSNAIGVSGAAPQATLVGLRLIAGPADDAEEAAALTWRNDLIQIYSNSWGPDDDGQTLEGPGPATLSALQSGTASGRGGRGSIFVWAAGNGGDAGDNANKDGYANSIHVIAVAASDSNGTRPSYSESGANVAVCAPSDGSLGIVTTDLTGTNGYNSGFPGSGEPADIAYTNSFGGTSSATPLVAGAVALMLEANPLLGWRDVKEILMRTARQLQPTSTEWATNGAGLRFHHDFGAGQIDATAAISMARTWVNRLPMQSTALATTSLPVSIPNNSATGVVRTFSATGAALRVEHVTLTLTARHPARGELEITLTAPSGMVSRLMPAHGDMGADYTAWTFSSVRHWGELSSGTWTLRVADRSALTSTAGSLDAAVLTLYGTPANTPPSVTAAVLTPAPDAAGHSYFDRPLAVADVQTTDPEGDPVSLSWQWQESADGSTWSDIIGATAATWLPGSAFSGRRARCVVTPRDAVGAGTPWISPARPLDRRPLQHAARGTSWSYDSDLAAPATPSFTRSVLVSEISQGQSGAREWVELLVTRTTDLRGWRLTDRLDTYCTFSNSTVWASVPAGTLVVVHNGAERDPALPAADNDPAGGSMIVAHSDTTLFTPGSWSGLSGSNSENIQIRDAANSLVDGVSFNGNTTYQPSLGTLATNRAARWSGGSEADADLASAWLITATAEPANVSPGLPNGGANSTMVAAIRAGGTPFTAAPLPTGLVVDPLNGVVSGQITAAPGRHVITLTRGAASRSFPLFVTDPATDRADPDNDGVDSLTEMALGRDPLIRDASAFFSLVPAAGPLALTFTVPAGSGPLRVIPETSNDLVAWQSGPTAIETVADVVIGDVRTITVRPTSGSAAAASRLLLRLRATLDP